MSKILINFIFALFLNSFCLSQVNYSSMTLENAMKKAKTNNKKIFVYFTTSWCSRCKLLDKEVFLNKTMSSNINQKFVCLKMDGDSKTGKKMMIEYGVQDLYPTTLILDHQAKEIDRIIGYHNQTEYYEEVIDYYNNKNTLQNLLSKVKNEQKNGENYYLLVLKYEKYRNIKKQLFYLQKAMNFEPYKSRHYEWYHLSRLYSRSNKNDKAIDALNHAIKLDPENNHYSTMLIKLKQN